MKILVLTEHDDCCGPMAAAFLNDYSEKVEAVSAGRHPAEGLPGALVAVMRECLIDLEGYQPKSIELFDRSSYDAVYECLDSPCPFDLGEARRLRDLIKNEAFKYYKKSRT